MLVILLLFAMIFYVGINVFLSFKKRSATAGPLKVLLKQLINNFQIVSGPAPVCLRVQFLFLHCISKLQISILKTAEIWGRRENSAAITSSLASIAVSDTVPLLPTC